MAHLFVPISLWNAWYVRYKKDSEIILAWTFVGLICAYYSLNNNFVLDDNDCVMELGDVPCYFP
jgi:hypothetical protein